MIVEDAIVTFRRKERHYGLPTWEWRQDRPRGVLQCRRDGRDYSVEITQYGPGGYFHYEVRNADMQIRARGQHESFLHARRCASVLVITLQIADRQPKARPTLSMSIHNAEDKP